MAAITGTAITVQTLALNTGAEVAYTDATNSGTAGTDTETFEVIPTKGDKAVHIFVKNGSGATVTFSVLSGDMWAAIGNLAEVTVATGKTFAITVDSARFKTSAGKLKIRVTPTAGTALTASAKVQLAVLQS